MTDKKSLICVMQMVELEDGLTSQKYKELLDMIGDDVELHQLCFSKNNSTVHGFIRSEFYDTDVDDEIKSKILEVLDDWNLESKDGIYPYDGTYDIYMGCDTPTIIKLLTNYH